MIPDPEDTRTGLHPISLERLIDLLIAHEDLGVIEEIVAVIDEHETGYHELSWNVWYVDIDLDTGRALYDHDFDPYQGAFPLPEFEAALRRRLS